MYIREARELATRIAMLVEGDRSDEVYALLAPVLAERTPFRLLDSIGEILGNSPLPVMNDFMKEIAMRETEGGWVVVARALGQQLDRDPAGAFSRCRVFIIKADIWYAADIFGERVPGPALVANFRPTLDLLSPWREDVNRWVRRIIGVAVHFWAKRSRGAPKKSNQAEMLLNFLEPMFEERNMDAVKGVGWGLKTLGRYYPDLVSDWLEKQIVLHNRLPRALMLRKALTYLTYEQRTQATGAKCV